MILTFINLAMFDGEGGTATAAPAQAGNEVSAAVALGQSNGVQETGNPANVAGEETFADLIGKDGKYRAEFQARVNRIVNDRLAKANKAAEAAQPVLDLLVQKYGTEDLAKIADEIGKDEDFWQSAADDAGMTVAQYRDFQMLKAKEQRLNAQVQAMVQQRATDAKLAEWRAEAEALQTKYPGLDLDAESQNPTFARMLAAGASVENAYQMLHHDELVNNAIEYAMGQAQKNIADTVRANGMRPAENGVAGSTSPVSVDLSNMSKQQRQELFSYQRKTGAKVRLF